MSEETTLIAKNVGYEIAKYRRQVGLSQAQVAEALNLSVDAISRIERGNIVPNVPRLFEFAELFGCAPSSFLMNSHRVEDQSSKLYTMLAKLNAKDRTKLLNIIEQMISWKSE